MNDETKTFLVELFDVKLAQNKKEIIKEITESFDAKLDQNRKEITESFDAKLARNKKELTDLFNKKFAEQREYIEDRLSDQTIQVIQVVNEILLVVNNKFKRERKKTDEKIKKEIAVL